MKLKLFMDNVLNNDESVKFYTGFPALTCFIAIFNILKPLAEKLKYWTVIQETNPLTKRVTTFQKFILTLSETSTRTTSATPNGGLCYF